MLGILFIYFIGKKYYDLAAKYNQNKWLYAILGIVIYYLTSIVLGVFLGILNSIFMLNIDFDNLALMTILSLLFGLSAVFATYYFLEKKWEKEKIVPINEIDSIGETNED